MPISRKVAKALEVLEQAIADEGIDDTVDILEQEAPNLAEALIALLNAIAEG